MILVLDTETNGFGKEPVLQLAWMLFKPDGQWYLSAESYFGHDFEYEHNPKAQEIHNLSKEFLAENGVHPKAPLEWFVKHFSTAITVVGHNLSFDLSGIGRECERYGIPFEFTMTDPRMVCTMGRTKEFCHLKDIRGRSKFPNLSELHYRLFCEDFTEAHTALGDVRATARCYFELKRRGIVG